MAKCTLKIILFFLPALFLLVSMPLPAEAQTSQIYWGAYIHGGQYGRQNPPWDTVAIDMFEANAGKRISILHWGQAWYWTGQGGYQYFDTQQYEKVRQRGTIPFVDWGSWDLAAGGSTSQPLYSLKAIISGNHDNYIRSWATGAKNWGKPFFLRFDWEMNGNWYPWSELRNGNSAGEFAAAWRHVHDIFKSVGANNVSWVWCPNTVYSGSIPLSGLYPGDAYVDWTCIDGYNWGTNPAKPDSWKGFYTVFKSTYDQLLQISPNKPIIIGETASTEFGGSKSSWITDAFLTQLPANFPRIKGVLWFNWNADGMDWIIESSASARAAFANSIASNYYAKNDFATINTNPISPIGGNSTPTSTPTPSSSPSPAASLSPTPTFSSGTNMLGNPSFEVTGSTPWYSPWYVRNDLGATFTQDGTNPAEGAYSIKASLSQADPTQPWVVALHQANLSLVSGRSYTLSFWAKASATRTIKAVIQNQISPYSEFFVATPNLTVNWQKFSYNFTPGASLNTVMLNFNLASSIGDVYIDNVSFCEGQVCGIATPTATSTTTKLGDANGDSIVDYTDYMIWLNNFGRNAGGAANGDFNNDLKVDGLDYVIWLNNFGR